MSTPPPDYRRLFGADPGGYDRARPEYPSRVYEILTTRCGLRPGAATLEIGPGSGLATRRLLAFGADPLVVVEPDDRLAAYLSEQLRAEGRSIDLRVEPFEEVTLDASSFDLVVSATAFHWLDQPVALAKVGRILKPGGWLASWWNVFGDAFGVDAFHQATQHIMEPLGRPAVNPDGRLPFALDAEARLADLRAAGAFDEIDHEIMPWPARFDPGQIRALYATFPNVSGLPEPRRSAVLDALVAVAEREFGGLVERTFYTPIYVARRASEPSRGL